MFSYTVENIYGGLITTCPLRKDAIEIANIHNGLVKKNGLVIYRAKAKLAAQKAS